MRTGVWPALRRERVIGALSGGSRTLFSVESSGFVTFFSARLCMFLTGYTSVVMISSVLVD